jgi:hypothetical protein
MEQLMTKEEALNLALDALETSMYPQQKQLQAITAIKDIMAQPEPWEKFCDSNCVWTDHHPDCKLEQRTWVGLTDEDWNRSKHTEDFQKGVDWAESMLKARNT